MCRYFLVVLILAACSKVKPQVKVQTENNVPLCHQLPGRFLSSEMIMVNSRQYLMGTNSTESYASERPAHPVKVNTFWIDKTEVTNFEFQKFVTTTGYKTVAERKPSWEELKKQLPPDAVKPDASLLVPASLVFSPPQGDVDLSTMTWWKWVPGASWKTPTGPGSSIEKLLNHPVTHVALEDAKAFCSWIKKRLPTEAEWELAARGGLENKTYSWGEDLRPAGKFMANTFQGKFPKNNSNLDGFLTTSPVMSFPANGYGVFDMIGNVWEWTSDYYDVSYYEKFKNKIVIVNPNGPDKVNDPSEPNAIKHVIKGGSYLCSDDYCVNYRPSARLGAAYDSGTSHIGFRCVKDKHDVTLSK